MTCHQLVSVTHCSVVLPCGHTHRSSKPASNTNTNTNTNNNNDNNNNNTPWPFCLNVVRAQIEKFDCEVVEKAGTSSVLRCSCASREVNRQCPTLLQRQSGSTSHQRRPALLQRQSWSASHQLIPTLLQRQSGSTSHLESPTQLLRLLWSSLPLSRLHSFSLCHQRLLMHTSRVPETPRVKIRDEGTAPRA